VLSPVAWRLFGCSAATLRTNESSIVVPIGCLGIFSIFDLKCELAHARTRCRSRLIIPACERSRRKLKPFAGQPHAFRDRPRWQSWAIARIEAACQSNLALWDLFADLQADRKLASQYGSFAVSSWIQRSQLAYFSVRECVAERIVPLAEEGILVSVSESCRAFHALFENEWLASLRKQMVENERKPEVVSPVLLRLGALQHGLQTAGGQDPRSATTLFDELAELEESVARSEIGIAARIPLQRSEPQQFAEAVLIPLMKKEVTRNGHLVGDWTVADLPGLIERKHELSLAYVPDPRFLFASEQREALIPGLFTSFLAAQLVAIGWMPSHSDEEGLTLSLGERSIRPDDTVHALLAGEISREGFLRLIE
jgi:hypothetical protein